MIFLFCAKRPQPNNRHVKKSINLINSLWLKRRLIQVRRLDFVSRLLENRRQLLIGGCPCCYLSDSDRVLDYLSLATLVTSYSYQVFLSSSAWAFLPPPASSFSRTGFGWARHDQFFCHSVDCEVLPYLYYTRI